MFPSWSWLMALMVGAAVGSFLNMVIYRLPRKLSFSNPPKSFCPKCKHSLHWMDLFPLFSWLSTGGKCRYCKAPIAVRYFLVEVVMGALYSGLWWQYLIADYDPLRMAFYMAATACLVAIIFIDWELYIIPDEINALLLFLGVGFHAIRGSLDVALWGAIAGWGILWGIAMMGRLLFGKDAMGHGDIKMMRGVGALIGPVLMIANMGIAVVAGLVLGLAIIGYASLKRAPAGPDLTPEAEEFLGSLRLTELQAQQFKDSSQKQGRDWQEVAIGAKKAGVASYDDLIALGSAETIGSLLKFGFFYLVSLDVLGVFWHGAYKLIGEEFIDENIEDDTWEPSLTTIPFGPYLAVGALVCMLFGQQIETFMRDYWRNATGASVAVQETYEFKSHRRFGSFTSLTVMKAGISSPTLIHRPGSNLARLDRIPPGIHLMNWNKIERNLVRPDGESGAYCA